MHENYQDVYESFIFCGYHYKSSATVYEGDILIFHIFEALNDNLETQYFHWFIFTVHPIFW